MYGRPSGNGRGQNGSNTVRAGMAAAITPIVKNYQTSSGSAGSGASGGGEWGSLNPNLYQNMSNDQVDWAALAQQWIQMKETLPPEMVPAAPPPPMISNHYRSTTASLDSPPSSSPDGMRLETIDEQGEAPMEVERDEDHSHSGGQQQQNSAWQNGTTVSPWQYPAASEWRNPAWETNWSTGGNQSNKTSSSYDSGAPLVNPQASMAVANWQAKMSRIYKLPGNDSEPIAGTVQPAGSKQHQTDSSKRIPGLMDQVINLDHGSEDQQGDQDEDTTQTINDAKRKLLPAWIREGLEKMEREKLRQAEREKEQKQREQMLEQRRQAEIEALNELESAKKKSKFESDSEEEDAADGDEREGDGRSRDASPAPVRSREEILQELMIAVRKNLTEILLEVTNEEIAVLAKETLAKTRRKAPTAQALRKTGLATLTGGLGLGIYGDSDEDDDDDDGSGSENARDNGGSSGGEDENDERSLRNAIKQRQKEFEWTAREIEDQLAQEEAREERKRREYELQQQQQNQDQHSQRDSDDEDAYGAGSSSRAGFGHAASSAAGVGGSVSGGKSGSRDGETHQPVNDKIYANKLGRTRDKRISRFSDPKDTVRQTHITHVAIVNHKPGDVIPPLQIPKIGQPVPTATAISSGISPPPVLTPTSAPLFPAAVIGSLESYRRGSSVASETPSNASSSRASSSHRSGRDRGHREKSSSSSSHRSHKSKKHKRSRYSRSDDENECYVEEERDDDRYSQYSRRSRSSERSSHSRRRRSYSRDSREETRSRRSRSPRDHHYRSARRSRSRTRSPLSRRGRY